MPSRPFRAAAAAAALVLWPVTVGCAHLPPFGADLGRQEVRGKLVRAPYATVVSYFGYIAPGAHLEVATGGDRTHHLYAWLPAQTPEIGVRVVSPVRALARPQAGVDAWDPAFLANRDSEVYFDPCVRVERCLAAIDPEDITKPCPQWVTLGENDDSDELLPQPNGARHNAQVRVATSGADPLRALVRGLYRVALTQAKVGEVHGSYLVQWGTPGLMPGMALARDTRALGEAVHARAASVPPA